MRSRAFKIEVRSSGSTSDLPLILFGYRVVAVGGMYGVAVKGLVIIRNTACDGGLPRYC